MSPQILGVLIPIIAILAGAIMAVARILATHREQLLRAELRHRERLAAIDKGLELPPDAPELAEPPATRQDEARFLRNGLVLLLLGIVLTFAMAGMPGADVPYLFGLVPAAVGLAYLLYYFIHGRHAGQPRDASRPPAEPSGGSGPP